MGNKWPLPAASRMSGGSGNSKSGIIAHGCLSYTTLIVNDGLGLGQSEKQRQMRR